MNKQANIPVNIINMCIYYIIYHTTTHIRYVLVQWQERDCKWKALELARAWYICTYKHLYV